MKSVQEEKEEIFGPKYKRYYQVLEQIYERPALFERDGLGCVGF